MNTQSRFKFFIALLFVSLISIQSSYAKWQELRPGISYQDLSPILIHDWSHIHVFKIDPKQYQFELVQHQQTSHHFPTINQYAEHQHAPLSFNGGFFDNQQHPLGLRISKYQRLNPFKNISWWGVFYIKNQIPNISSAKNFSYSKQIEFAIQSGPRLLVDGHFTPVHQGYAERTALCILPDNQIAVIITQYYPTTLHRLAEILKSAPLHCQDAINLDGGSSTQFFAKFYGFYRHMSGITSVSDAITVMPRS